MVRLQADNRMNRITRTSKGEPHSGGKNSRSQQREKCYHEYTKAYRLGASRELELFTNPDEPSALTIQQQKCLVPDMEVDDENDRQ